MLVVDISPMAVNRTAIYFIVRDTVKHLIVRGVKLRLVAMGKPLPVSVFIANGYALPQPFENGVLGRLHELVEREGARYFPPTNTDDVYLVFDPLYIFNAAGARRVICFVLDLTPFTRPAWHADKVSRTYAAAFERLYEKSVDLVAISHSTARDLWANFGISRERVTWVPLYDRLGESCLPREPRNVFLFVGSLEQRKNIAGLVEGFNLSGLAGEGFSLHIVGGLGHGGDTIQALARGRSGVHLLGRLSDEDLLREYAQCYALTYLSYWEGFGLPVLEALRRGIPMLLADTGALPEVAGTCATYVDPCNVQSIASGFRKIASLRGKIEDGTDFAHAAAVQLATYSKEKYLDAVDSLLQPYVECAPSNADGPLAWRNDATKQVSRFGRWLMLKRTRVLPVSSGEVPGDSFSLDYLYGIQQERRMALSRALASLMTANVLRLPANMFHVLIEYLCLRITNVTVQAMINETVAMKLSESVKEGKNG